MTAKSITTKLGGTIKVEMVREVHAKHTNDWGEEFGREIYEVLTITVSDNTGKVKTQGNHLTTLDRRFDKSMMDKGAAGRVGDAYIGQEMYDMIAALIAEVDAETPKSDEQIAIETAKAAAEAEHDAWYNSPEEVAYREFTRKMEAANSDY